MFGLGSPKACEVLAPQTEMESMPPPNIGRWILKHWTIREVQIKLYQNKVNWGKSGASPSFHFFIYRMEMIIEANFK